MTLRDKFNEWMNAVENVNHRVNAAQEIFNKETTNLYWSLEWQHGCYDPRRQM
jgi:hypothetical protein